MHLQSLYPAIGLLVGLTIGLTGVGGGSLMTPILVFLFGIPVPIAVGTDLLFASITKIAGAAAHSARGHVDWKIVRTLAAGSLPASIVTVAVMGFLKAQGRPLDGLILPVLGISLVGTAAAILLRRRINGSRPGQYILTQAGSNRVVLFVGVVLGVLVTLTSVGAGAIGVAALLLLFPALGTATVVGTDLAHAIPLITLAGLGHLQLGNVDYRLLVGLLAGSVPGIYVGTMLSSRLPEVMMRRILVCVLLVMGIACVVGG